MEETKGELGFAKVKGYSFWPARKVGEAKKKVWVKFFGVEQLGCVTNNEKHWMVLSDLSFKKLVYYKRLIKPSYKKAVIEMTTVIKETFSDIALLNYVSGYEQTYLSSSNKKQPRAPDVVCESGVLATMVEGLGVGITMVEGQEVVNPLAEEGIIGVPSDCSMATVELTICTSEVEASSEIDAAKGTGQNVAEDSKTKHQNLKTKGQNKKNETTILKYSKLSSNPKSVKKRDERMVLEKKARKTLRDDQKEVNKSFKDKIVEKDSGFSCKLCDFAAGMLLKAKTHAISCGKKKRKFKIRKHHKCHVCQETFAKKKTLNNHFRDSHQTSGYKCSKCFATYKIRKSYTLHLKSHDAEFLNRFKCDMCSYKTRDNWLLKRHKILKHELNFSLFIDSILNELIESATLTQNNDIVEIEVDELIDVDDNGSAMEIIDGEIRGEDELRDGPDNVIYEVEVEETGDIDEARNADDISGDNEGEENDVVDNVRIYDEMCGDVHENEETSVTNEIRNYYESSEMRYDETGDNEIGGDGNADESSDEDPESGDENVSPNVVNKNKPLCRWEEIRLSIIKEREEKMAAANIFEGILEAKRDMIKKPKTTRKNKAAANSSQEMRRSSRVRSKKVDANVEDVEIKDPEIKLEIKIELLETGDNINENIGGISSVEGRDGAESEEVFETDNEERGTTRKESVELSDIVNLETRVKQYKCSKCDYSTIDNYHLKRHVSSMHEVAEIQCLICSTIFNEKFKFNQHYKNCCFKCKYSGCHKKFKSIDQMNAHNRSHVKMLRRLV